MKKEWVIASTNRGKIEEIKLILAPLGVKLYSQAEFKCPEIEELGSSFEENAILKARHAATVTGLPALADDSGLEIDALRGQPGIFSARFAGPERDDKANINKVLQLMAGLSKPKRTARFRCVIAFVPTPTSPPQCFHGSWEGFIADEEQGELGFGYDSIFFDPVVNCCVGCLSPDAKARRSHRGKALKSFQAYLQRSAVSA